MITGCSSFVVRRMLITYLSNISSLAVQYSSLSKLSNILLPCRILVAMAAERITITFLSDTQGLVRAFVFGSYVASSNRHLPSLFKLCPCASFKNGPGRGGHIFSPRPI